MTEELKALSPEELNEKRQVWATYHDRKTSGIMGFLPLVKNLPLHVTQTDAKHKDKLFKNKRGRLTGGSWQRRMQETWRIVLPQKLNYSICQQLFSYSSLVPHGISLVCPKLVCYALQPRLRSGILTKIRGCLSQGAALQLHVLSVVPRILSPGIP